MLPLPKFGLYAITAQRYPELQFLAADIQAAVAGGAAVIQLRDKSADAAWRLEAARAALSRCRAAGVPLIINDDLDLARAVGADGVHLGRDDGDLKAMREAAGPDLLLGVSCYNQLERAEAAVTAGADYLAFGSMYPSVTKPGAVHCGPEVLGKARKLGKPVVAIGGITPENGGPLIEAGADFLAVIEAVFGAPDVRQAAEGFAALWKSP
jgi:thiamine-phosphate pyrophosphorylase